MGALTITMRDVARRGGVSQATVSLCLAHSPLANAATRERIRTLAQTMGYRTNPLVAAHMRTRRRPASKSVRPVLAVINTQATRLGWRHGRAQVLLQMWQGVQQRITAQGYTLQEFWLYEPNISNARLSDILRHRGIPGVLFGPSSNSELTLEMKWDDLAAVRLGSGCVSPALHRMVNNQYQTTVAAVQACAAEGYRRPGLMVREELNRYHERQWEAGYDVACKHLGVVTPLPILFQGAANEPAVFDRWLHQHQPDVVLDVSEDDGLKHLRRLGRQVPRDIGFVTLCSPALGSPLSGMVQDGVVIGARAVDWLIQLVESNERGLPERPMTQSTVPQWNAGQTLRAQA